MKVREVDRPKQLQLPNGKKNIADLTLEELMDYYNKELLKECGGLLEYKAYLDGQFEIAEKNRDFETAKKVATEFEYWSNRTDFVSQKMIGIRKLLDMFTGGDLKLMEGLEKK